MKPKKPPASRKFQFKKRVSSHPGAMTGGLVEWVFGGLLLFHTGTLI